MLNTTLDIFCENCSDWVYCVSSFGKPSRRIARKNAAALGWVFVYDFDKGKYVDLCPDCQKTQKKPDLIKGRA